jgi:anti-sigma regulatory factor (Ser/Thr protein kinase)
VTTQHSPSTGSRFESAFRHAALIVDSDATVRARLVPALRASLTSGEDVLLVVSKETERVVREELGAQSDELDWGDPAAFYRRLGFTFEGFRRYLAEQHAAAHRVQVVAEPDIPTNLDADSPVDRAAAYLSYESMCNEAFAGYGCAVICLWDSRRHPTLIIENVRSLHTHEITDGGHVANPRHVPTAEYLAGRNEIPLPEPSAAADLDSTLTDLGQMGQLRSDIWAWAVRHRFADDAATDVVVAVTEVVANGLIHGAAPVQVRCWERLGTLVVEVQDAGGRPIPPIAGYVSPDTGADTGRGLWLARQLADVVTVHTGHGRTCVRLHFPYDITHRD